MPVYWLASGTTPDPMNSGYFLADYGEANDAVDASKQLDTGETLVILNSQIVNTADDGQEFVVSYNPTTSSLTSYVVSLAPVRAPLLASRSGNYAAGSRFENADRNPWDLRAGFAEVSSSRAYTGTQSLRLFSHDGSAKIYPLGDTNADFIDVEPGDIIQYSFWASRNTDYNGAGSNCKIRFGNLSNNNALIVQENYRASDLPVANTWYKMEDEFTVPSGCYKLQTSLFTTHTAGDVYLDDIVIKRKPQKVGTDSGLVDDAGIWEGKFTFDFNGIVFGGFGDTDGSFYKTPPQTLNWTLPPYATPAFTQIISITPRVRFSSSDPAYWADVRMTSVSTGSVTFLGWSSRAMTPGLFELLVDFQIRAKLA